MRGLAGFLVLGGLATAHILAVNRGDRYAGVLIVLDHLFSLALVLGLFAIAAAVGGRLLKAGGLKPDGSLDALLFWTAVGLGAVATAIVIVGLAFSVRPGVLLSILAAAAVLGRKELRELPAVVGGALSFLRARADRFSASVFLLMALFLIAGALAPPTDWDALMYHLRVPEQFLRHGSIYLPDDNPHVAFVGLPHMLYLPLLALGSPAGPALVSALCTLGLALAAFALGLRVLDERTAGFSLAALWGSTILVLVAITPRTDTILAFYLFLVHYAVIRAKQAEDPRFLYLAAALGGMAFGVKYNALIYLLALAPLGLWIVRARRPDRRGAVALVLGIALVAASPWLLKNGLLLGDPLYPYLAEPRLDPWLARLYGGATVPPHVDPAALGAVWRAQAAFNLGDFFAAPQRITVEGEGVFYHPNLLLLLVPLWLLFWKRKALTALAAPALGYALLVVLLQPTTSLRYLIPAFTPLTLVAFHSLALALDKILSPGPARVVLWATALFVLTGTASFIALQVTNGAQVEYLVGSSSRAAFLARRTGGYADVVSFVNERLPRDSRVLMLFDARGYYFRLPVIQDNAITNWLFVLPLPKAAGPDCLRSAGITHVLLNAGAIHYYGRRGVDLAPLRLDALERFARDCFSPLYSSGGITVFRLGGGPAPQ